MLSRAQFALACQNKQEIQSLLRFAYSAALFVIFYIVSLGLQNTNIASCLTKPRGSSPILASTVHVQFQYWFWEIHVLSSHLIWIYGDGVLRTNERCMLLLQIKKGVFLYSVSLLVALRC